MLNNIITFLFLLNFLVLMTPNEILAGGACSSAGECSGNQICVWIADPSIVPEGGYLSNSGGPCGSSSIGGVAAPTAIANINSTTGIGLLAFISKLLNFGAIVGGIIVMLNFVSAGMMYISGAGNTETHTKVRDKITYSIIGIIIIVSAYTIVGLAGLIFFQDATYLLNPRLQGAFDGI